MPVFQAFLSQELRTISRVPFEIHYILHVFNVRTCVKYRIKSHILRKSNKKIKSIIKLILKHQSPNNSYSINDHCLIQESGHLILGLEVSLLNLQGTVFDRNYKSGCSSGLPVCSARDVFSQQFQMQYLQYQSSILIYKKYQNINIFSIQYLLWYTITVYHYHCNCDPLLAHKLLDPLHERVGDVHGDCGKARGTTKMSNSDSTEGQQS